jgi:hypothetical protein
LVSGKQKEEDVNYKVGDGVTVVRSHRSYPFWPFRRFWMPRPGFPYGRAKGSGTIVEVIEPHQDRGVTNAGGYKVQLENGSTHYYSEAELRPTSGKNR